MDTFQVGTVLGMSFRAFARKLIPFVVISMALFAPVLLYALNWLQGVRNHGLSGDMSQFTIIATVISALAGSLVTAALTYCVVNDMHGQRAGIGACIARGISSLWVALGVAIVAGLAVVGGLLLLVVPGVIVACMFYVAVPVAVMEQTSVMGALRRSRELTQGHKGQVFGLMLLFGMFRIAVSKVAPAVMPTDTYQNAKRLLYVQFGLDATFAALTAVIAAVAYCALRAEKDGPVMTQLGTAFEHAEPA